MQSDSVSLLRLLPGPAVALFLALAAGCGMRQPPPAIDRSLDPAILRDVQARIAAEPALDASRIRVEVTGGMVQLYGSVDGVAAWRCVHRNAQLVEGVTSVVDYLVIERGPAEIRCGAPRNPPESGFGIPDSLLRMAWKDSPDPAAARSSAPESGLEPPTSASRILTAES